MTPDVKNPRCGCNGPGCPDCNSPVSRGHGAQGDPATAATLGHALAFETAAGIPLEALAEFNDEGETGRNAAGRAAIARKMQRIAAVQFQGTTIDELVSTVARAERGELR